MVKLISKLRLSFPGKIILLIFFFWLTPAWLSPGPNPQERISIQDFQIPHEYFKHLTWRNIGPANMMGRTTDIEGVPGNPRIVYVGTASGGVWKTTNGGITWEPIFDDQPVASIGDLALEPGNPEVIYVGTGEANLRNSVSFGNGVYKSTDGGKTWVHLGLRDTRHISRIVINPRRPEVVLVGAVGHAFGPNQSRGVFRSEDGGRTWRKVLYLDEYHGVSDLEINPRNPNIVYAALWRFIRYPWTFRSGDTSGGLYRSVDGGKTWQKLTNGLPRLVGRIGVKVAPSNPQVVYAMTESPEGTLYRSDDGGDSWRCVSKEVGIVSRGFYYTDLRVDPLDENRVYAVSSRLQVSEDGGRTFKTISSATHVDYHALWIDPLDPNRMWQGQDGGIAVSYDHGKTWEYVNVFPVGQFYQIFADNRLPFYYVGGGLQDNGTWYGPSRTRETFGILNDEWRMISFGDGFHVVSHPDNPDLFLSESQGGNIFRTNMLTREQQNVSPQPRRADGDPVEKLKYRFNWNTPIVLSPHDKNTVYVGGNVVFKSKDFGTTWEVISPDLTTNDPEKQKAAGGPAWPENTTAEYHCTIISLAESPVQPGILWAGTDDGYLQVTKNGGESWENVTANISGLPPNSPVSHIEPSRASAGKAYVTFDRHMLDDYRPYVFVTTDFGITWKEISKGLPPTAYVWVIREDPRNPNVLYLGTEVGLFVSFSGGEKWQKLHLANLPTVAVHDILIQLRENDLILGTHGRAIWILDDITFLQKLTPEVMAQSVYLFSPRLTYRFAMKPTRYGIGDKVFRGPNPPYGVLITYLVNKEFSEKEEARLEIYDSSGQLVRTLKRIPVKRGINRVAWDLRFEPPRPRREEKVQEDFFRRGPRGPQVLPGKYTLRLIIGQEKREQVVEVKMDPQHMVSQEDLRLQLSYSFQLRELISQANDLCRSLDSLLSQLRERQELLTKAKNSQAEEVTKRLTEVQKQALELEDKLVRPEGKPFWSVGPRLVGQLNQLFRAIDGVDARPTPAQLELFNELRREFQQVKNEVRSFLVDEIPRLNKFLQKKKVPVLLIPRANEE